MISRNALVTLSLAALTATAAVCPAAGVHERRSRPRCPMLGSDGLDPTAENCVLLFHLIERRIQLPDNASALSATTISSTSIFL
jgi:hypothetical protein